MNRDPGGIHWGLTNLAGCATDLMLAWLTSLTQPPHTLILYLSDNKGIKGKPNATIVAYMAS